VIYTPTELLTVYQVKTQAAGLLPGRGPLHERHDYLPAGLFEAEPLAISTAPRQLLPDNPGDELPADLCWRNHSILPRDRTATLTIQANAAYR